MNDNRLRASLLAITVAAAVALSGTFAWQNISQVVYNEAGEVGNPGGRLHDDFSGWKDSGTKDIYVENFGNQVIFARVRLDEYMEIGDGAGLKEGEPGVEDKVAKPMVSGTSIDDHATWTTHLPGDSADQTGAGAETGFTDSGETFHKYWKWTMGGQDSGNPEGKTVYMPTFNKNTDSLMPDVNGTMDGLDPTDDFQYNDYVPYTAGVSTAKGVWDTSVSQGAFYDLDDDSFDEGGKYGNGGVEGVNYEVVAETHTAAETLSAKVITMDEYINNYTDEEKKTLLAWVYDTDGWAYWSQPIQPETATGVLLDKVEMAKEPPTPWHYSINAVAQFITADDLGYNSSTGFYSGDGPDPSPAALTLLDFIGVNTSAVGST